MIAEIKKCVEQSPVTVLLGARQAGKSTAAGLFALAWKNQHTFDLERAADRSALSTPELTLSSLQGLASLSVVP